MNEDDLTVVVIRGAIQEGEERLKLGVPKIVTFMVGQEAYADGAEVIKCIASFFDRCVDVR
jgi:hypothetical protein